jgi:hypothetical protein
MTAALPMGSQKITGMADPTVATDGATKNYVDTTTSAFFGTGDLKPTIKIVADAGWLLLDDGTFGSATSGSSNSNNAANLALFTLVFNNLTDTFAPIFTSGGGATTRAAQTNAASAWAANCRMSLPKALGRAIGVAGTGSGLTARTLGQTFGEESHVLTVGELPGGITSAGANTITVAASGGTGIPATNSGSSISDGLASGSAGTIHIPATSNTWHGVDSLSGSNTINVTSNNTGGTGHNTLQPTVFVNCMIKL